MCEHNLVPLKIVWIFMFDVSLETPLINIKNYGNSVFIIH